MKTLIVRSLDTHQSYQNLWIKRSSVDKFKILPADNLSQGQVLIYLGYKKKIKFSIDKLPNYSRAVDSEPTQDSCIRMVFKSTTYSLINFLL